MLQVQGRSDLFLGLEIVKKIIGLGPLFVGAFVGIFPMLYTTILTSIISYFLNSYFPGKLLGYTCWKQLKDISLSFFIAFSMAVFVYTIKYLPFSYWLILPLQIVLGLSVLIFLCKIARLEEYNEIVKIVKSTLNKISK